MMREISVFGVTGSVGESWFDLLMRQGGPASYRTVALTGGRNVARLAGIARALQAEPVVCAADDGLPVLRDALAGTRTTVAAGAGAIAGSALRPTAWRLR